VLLPRQVSACIPSLRRRQLARSKGRPLITARRARKLPSVSVGKFSSKIWKSISSLRIDFRKYLFHVSFLKETKWLKFRIET